MAVLFTESALCAHCGTDRDTDRTLYTQDHQPACWACYLAEWDYAELWDSRTGLRLPEQLTITVTWEDIQKGSRESGYEEAGLNSPFARAANREAERLLGPGWCTESTGSWLLISNTDWGHRVETYDLPERAQRWLNYWYDRRRVHPITFVATHGKDFLLQEQEWREGKREPATERPKVQTPRLPLRVKR